MPDNSRILVITPTLSLTPYAIGDQMGAVNTLDFAFDIGNDSAQVLSATVIDKAKRKGKFDILLFNEAPAVVSVDNAALNISGAEMAAKFLGRISIIDTDYSDLSGCSIASVLAVGLGLEGITSAKEIHAVVQSMDTKTYASAGDLIIKLYLLQD